MLFCRDFKNCDELNDCFVVFWIKLEILKRINVGYLGDCLLLFYKYKWYSLKGCWKLIFSVWWLYFNLLLNDLLGCIGF